ncbi:hypothetical protein BDN70DRAFT_396203 [Pholiota conissans]|uniref:Uncharacterized protein n=1 Tax=Pholiota conissans TaxID=109636 RepID=A0A9P5YQP7_9AGAR|nr:hypothetical protein BDN70DRAFT_396203 [Pholiota conissans]
MTPNKDNNPSTSNGGDNSDKGSNINAQDQILLMALQEFLVPLMQTVVDQEGMRAMNFKGPEAMNLISALKTFVSTVVGGTVREHEAHRRIKIKKDDSREESTVARYDMSAEITHSLSLSTLSTNPRTRRHISWKAFE